MAKKQVKNKFKILLVDDEEDLLIVTKESIEPYFEEVYTASSVREALSVLETPAIGIDLVVCDFKMPNQDGLTLRNAILSNYPKIRFVLLTAYSFDSKIIEAKRNSDLQVIAKPTQPDVLINRLEHLFVAPELSSSKEESLLNSYSEDERENYHDLTDVEKKKKIKKHSLSNRLKMNRHKRTG